MPAFAGNPSREQIRLVKLELELGMNKARGLGANHPVIQRIESSIQMLEKRIPVIRDEAYRKLLQGNRAKLETEQIRLVDDGYGDNHPERLEVITQLVETNRRLAILQR